MKARIALMTIFAAILGASSQSYAAPQIAPLACEGDDAAEVCVSLPGESPEDFLETSSTTKVESMLTQSELQGGALSVENEVRLAFAVDPVNRAPAPSQNFVAAVRAQEKMRSVETFLKNGSASRGSLLAIITAVQDR